jgi:hypothetical protein
VDRRAVRKVIGPFVDLVLTLEPGQHFIADALGSNRRSALAAIAHFKGARYRTKTLTGGRFRIERRA